MFLKSNRTLQLCLLACGLVTAVGCTSEVKTHPVIGKVLLPSGTPAQRGLVEFRTTTAEGEVVNAHGKIEPDGSFRLSTFAEHDGALAGEHQAIVLNPATDDGGPAHRAVYPERYSAYESSDLKFEIQPGPNEIVVQLKAK
ncbi:hypothetical protein [Blastopirellula marina]|uniref:Carboxypeptidase regulatory-like domain-containing protein n=1 Tax=Blastopirellula marina DSM 3645 TaxID=314230 RepID=A3ZWL9_9BACT|nr:hypothetical protein [Blastopirellula marina]EAQ78993.1 hypothetical protein DSM3645_13555 [Blastopirellula marina DSM 3645]